MNSQAATLSAMIKDGASPEEVLAHCLGLEMHVVKAQEWANEVHRRKVFELRRERRKASRGRAITRTRRGKVEFLHPTKGWKIIGRAKK